MMENSLERIVPELIGTDNADQQTLELHLNRYHFAGRHLLPGTVTDIACGTGYGSFLLATEYTNSVSKIYAVDKESFCTDYGKANYNHRLIDYISCDALHYTPAEPLSTIVSLETIEHLENPQAFVRRISEYLVPKGRFVASVPVTPSMDANPYHLHDFSIASFKKLFFDAGFREIDSFVQKQSYNPLFFLSRKESRQKDLRRNIVSFYFNHPHKFASRIQSLFSDGFINKYIVAVFEKA